MKSRIQRRRDSPGMFVGIGCDAFSNRTFQGPFQRKPAICESQTVGRGAAWLTVSLDAARTHSLQLGILDRNLNLILRASQVIWGDSRDTSSESGYPVVIVETAPKASMCDRL
jgi:hypothetical protein